MAPAGAGTLTVTALGCERLRAAPSSDLERFAHAGWERLSVWNRSRLLKLFWVLWRLVSDFP